MTFANDPSLTKLFRLYGPAQTEALVRDLLREIGLRELQTPEDRLRFGAALIKKGGLCEMVGRSIRVQAFLLGAKE